MSISKLCYELFHERKHLLFKFKPFFISLWKSLMKILEDRADVGKNLLWILCQITRPVLSQYKK
jgi:hypothetical protein